MMLSNLFYSGWLELSLYPDLSQHEWEIKPWSVEIIKEERREKEKKTLVLPSIRLSFRPFVRFSVPPSVRWHLHLFHYSYNWNSISFRKHTRDILHLHPENGSRRQIHIHHINLAVLLVDYAIAPRSVTYCSFYFILLPLGGPWTHKRSTQCTALMKTK